MSPRIMLLTLMVTIAAGCATPYGSRLSIDRKPEQIRGSIAVSDAKLYRREALINERSREVSYIDGLMAATEKEGFKIGPQVNREIEVIRTLALSAGLSFDPAAGRAFRDSSETAAIQQDIDVLQLQLQLDQLRRDAALFRERLTTQTDPSRTDLGQTGTGSSAVTAPALTPADTKDLVDRIDALEKLLASRIGVESKPVRGVSLDGSHIDQFRDRAAYRQLLTTARNAASLDELHDLNGAALYRLSFQVSTLPPPDKYLRTAGIVGMTPVNEGPDREEMEEIYGRWLDHINKTLLESKIADTSWLEIQGFFSRRDLLDTIELHYDDGSGSSKKQCASGFLPPDNQSLCAAKVVVAVPNLEPYSLSLPGNNHPIGTVVANDIGKTLLGADYSARTQAMMSSSNRIDLLVDRQQCALASVAKRRELRSSRSLNDPLVESDLLVSAAIATLSATPYLSQTMRRIAAEKIDDRQRAALVEAWKQLQMASDRANNVLKRLAEQGCAAGTRLTWEKLKLDIPDEFEKLVMNSNNISVYEIGPREQVQQVSTAARAADAFSLAMALAAKAPSTGAFGKAGLGYSRNAVGKVDTIERLPVVVGFAQTGGIWKDLSIEEQDPNEKPRQFGWILGPRIGVDPKRGALDLEQGYSVHDVSVDLAVSGWRTQLELDVHTAWSPDWRSKAFGSALWNDAAGPSRRIAVNLRPSSAEFAALTTLLAGGAAGRGQRLPTIKSIHPPTARACAPQTLVIEGENLWRATDILFDGTRISGKAISVLPDMNGIAVDVPASADFGRSRVEVQILTPYGVARYGEGLVVDGFKQEGCGKSAASGDPVITDVNPIQVNACSSPTFELTGSDLDKITAAQLGIAEGTVMPGTAGKRRVTFAEIDLKQIGTEYVSLVFIADKKPLPSRAIRIVRLGCGQ
jgi:hypothetical protein